MLMLTLVGGREADGDARLLPLHVAFPITDDENHAAMRSVSPTLVLHQRKEGRHGKFIPIVAALRRRCG
ncbi:hypothetical protein AB4Z01_06165 [Inquilinus sp. YAF38]|uniref:hypothetical protein n=1 Tax=Inquilinus sp. YAF38 TaxID=3233084 RepID=UPI003F8EBD17